MSKSTFADAYEFDFDSRGFDKLSVSNPGFDGKTSNVPLHLIGVGMRRKRFVMIDVDVYLVGFSASEKQVKKAVEWIQESDSGRSSLPLSKYLLKLTKNDLLGETSMKTTLRFVRAVDTGKVVEAFNDAFGDVDKVVVDEFKSSFRLALGASGVKKGDEVIFNWVNGKGIVISVNGVMKSTVQSTEIADRLLAVYIDQDRAVSPELVKSIVENLKLIAN
jgi:hypothetical protein